MSTHVNHPDQQRPRSKSTFSFKSDKSHGSHSRQERRESHEQDKRKTHYDITTKANPNAAMNEAQPIAAALEKPTLQSLRSFQHTDTQGNVIAEPDLSNPTRSRWERPLDTIRSFEAAIDNEYRRRAATMRAGNTSTPIPNVPHRSGTNGIKPESNVEIMSGYGSRRSSYYGGGYDQNRFSQVSGYHGGRQGGRDSWMDNGHGMGGPVGPVGQPPRTRYNRMQSDSQFRYSNNNHNNVYGPAQGYQQSRDTVNTNGSNGSHSEPYSNDPSSENSSIERPNPVKQPDLGEQYGFQGFGGGPILEEYGSGSGPMNNSYFPPPQQYNSNNGPPPVPAKNSAAPAVQSINSNPVQGPPANANARPNVLSRQSTEKRKSWFKRRFSKD